LVQFLVLPANTMRVVGIFDKGDVGGPVPRREKKGGKASPLSLTWYWQGMASLGRREYVREK